MEKTAVILGAGPVEGLGANLSMHAARAGLHVFISGRTKSDIEKIASKIINEGGKATAFCADATDPQEVSSLVDIAEQAGPIDLAVYNAGNAFPGDFINMSHTYFEEAWKVCTFGGFLFSQNVIKKMLPRELGTLLFTGASASVRGKPNFSAFSAAKAGLRTLSQSLAREFQPKGIHVGHVIIDGGIMGEKITSNYPDYVASSGIDGLIGLDGISETFMHLYSQPKNAWTHEIDIRTFKENF